MINRILMELYDDYSKGNIERLLDFAKKTFPTDGTDKLFTGSMLILFSRCGAFKGRYYASRENLLDIVKAAKEKVGKSNLLAFYMDRINTTKRISKYFGNVLNDNNLAKYADVIIDYLEEFRPHFIEDLKLNTKLKEYGK